MKRYLRLKLFILSVFLIFLSACHKKQTPQSIRKTTEKATVMIDRGEYNAAIELLENELTSPVLNESQMTSAEEREELNLVLASAYAARAGVKIENYWDYLIGFDVFAKTKSTDSSSSTLDMIPESMVPENIDLETKDKIKKINTNIKDLQAIEQKAAKIPLISESGSSDILRARYFLKNTVKASSKLYRSMLTAVQLKYHLAQKTQLLIKTLNNQSDWCAIHISELSTWLGEALSLINDGLEDLAVAIPSEKENYKRMQADIYKQQQDLTASNEVSDISKVLCYLKK